MVSERINGLISDPLRYRNLFRCRIVGDAQVRRVIGEMVERCRGIGFDPGYGKGRAFLLADLVVDEGVCQSSEEARLAGSTSGYSKLDWRSSVPSCTVICFCRLDVAGLVSGSSVKMRTGSHYGQT